MTDLREDQRLALANLHALAQATLRAPESRTHRAWLEALSDMSPDPIESGTNDPRSDEALGHGVSPVPAARRFAARLRGVILGAAAHADTVGRELEALAVETVRGEGVADAEVKQRASAAFARTREDLEQDIVRLAAFAPGRDVMELRRWGAVRSLELNGFIASFTRDGTHPGATKATSQGRDGGALRFAMAVAQAAMSLPGESNDNGLDALVSDAACVDAALPALIANLVVTARGR